MTDESSAETVATPNSESQASRSRIVKNTIFSVAAYLLSLPLALFVNSFVVHHIGLEQFGIWAALTTIVGYGGVLDLGVSVPLIKYVAEYIALGQRDDVNGLLGTAVAFYLVVAGFFVVAMTLASGWILMHLFHTAAHGAAVRELYFTMVVGFAISLIFSVLVSLIAGMQRTDLLSNIILAFNIIGSIGNVFVVKMGLGVQGLTVVWISTTLCNVAINWFVAKHLFRDLSLNPLRFTFTRLKLIMRFSTRIQITNVMLLANDQVDRTLITYALGPRQLGYYQLAARATNAARGISFSLMAAVLPAASDLAAVGDSSRLRELYLRGTRYLAITDFALCIGALGLIQPFVRVVWLGAGYDRVVVTMVIILIGYAVWLPSQALENALMGVNRPEIRMRADIAYLLVHIPLSATLLWRFGYYGAVSGTAITLTSTRLYIYVAGARVLGTTIWNVSRTSLLQPAIGGLVTLGAVFALHALPGVSPGLMLGAEILVFLGVYLGYTAIFVLDAYDRGLIRSVLRLKTTDQDPN
jgi:O-antigen/teichoic acid export membrane protein